MKILLPLFLCMGLALGTAAQTGAYNLDFENWQGTYPSGFIGSGVTKQTSGAYNGTNYARLTVANPSAGVYDGFLINSNGSKLGTPYAQMATSVSGYYRASIVGTDTINIVVNFKKKRRHSDRPALHDHQRPDYLDSGHHPHLSKPDTRFGSD